MHKVDNSLFDGTIKEIDLCIMVFLVKKLLFIVILDAKRCKSKEVESIEVLIYPFSINEDIDGTGFSWMHYP